MRIAVVGAGINGIMCSLALAQAQHRVHLFDRGAAMEQTSARSTKLLHGGLRYLEHGYLALVREGLRERSWWLQSAPQFAHAVDILLPVYRSSARGRLKLKVGLLAYDWLAGGQRLGWHRWVSRTELAARAPELRADELTGGYLYRDGQMDDYALGSWALARARAAGVVVREHTAVERVSINGQVHAAGQSEPFDFIVNAAGPWAGRLLEQSGVTAQHRLDLVRGSHLVVARRFAQGHLLQSPDDGRVCFVLPYKGQLLVGTTEVRQDLEQPVACSDLERAYLKRMFDAHLQPALADAEIVDSFAGLRPLIAGEGASASAASREYALERSGRLLTVFGGKWTTARALGQKVAAAVDAAAHAQNLP
jgi:glycerol-3-phosphate dehydrogenase